MWGGALKACGEEDHAFYIVGTYIITLAMASLLGEAGTDEVRGSHRYCIVMPGK